MPQSAFFQFYHSLNDFLSAVSKNESIRYDFTGTPAIKDAIEAIGVPHTEVDLIIANGSFVNFLYKLADNDVVEVYPVNATPEFLRSHSLTPGLNYPLSFVADVHLGKTGQSTQNTWF